MEREKQALRSTIAELDARLMPKQAAAARLDALSVYCARVARKLEKFGFAEKRLAFDAFGNRVLASGVTEHPKAATGGRVQKRPLRGRSG